MSRPKKIITECHNTCKRNIGNKCQFWRNTFRQLYRDTSVSHTDFETWMAKTKCSFYKQKTH